MPLLKMDRKGNIIETDSRFNGVQGIGRTPEMVDQEDMTELSLIPNSKELKDKQALRKLEHMTKVNRLKKYAHSQARKKLQEQKKAAYLEKLYQKKKQDAYRDQLYKDMSYLKAQQEGGKFEKMSGVTGYGLSADGRQAVLSQATVDYQPYLQSNVAFGGDAEEWGNETGFGQNSNTDVKKVTISSPNLGPMTQRDKQILEQWDQGVYGTPFYYKNRSGVAGVHRWRDHLKQQIVSKNMAINHPSKMQEFSQQGWGYSMYKDDQGKLHIVKVAYHWGIPMISPKDPYNKNYTPEYVYNMRYTNFQPSVPISGYTKIDFGEGISKEMKIWNALAPVIKAAAKEYQENFSDTDTTSKTPTAMDHAQETGSLFARFKEFLSQGSGDYNHPLIKQGLLK